MIVPSFHLIGMSIGELFFIRSNHFFRTAVCAAVVLTVITRIGVGANRLELINHVNLWSGSPIRSADTAGIAYHLPSGPLLTTPSADILRGVHFRAVC